MVGTLDQPSAAAATEVAMTATTRPSEPSGVCSSATIRTIVATPTASVAGSIRPGWISVSKARVIRLDAPDAYPVKFPSWPRMMFTPTALMKPTTTVVDTKRSTNPSRSRPATSMTTPVKIESVNRARAGSSARWTPGTSAMIIDIALVAWTAMNAELVNAAPVTVPIR